MKELSIEEKAKAYDEALKVLHKYDGANIMFTQDLKEEMFPELKESEDENTRKDILSFIKKLDHIYLSVEDNIDRRSEWIAWLEKQGEQKPTDKIKPRFKVGDWIVFNGLTLYIKEVVKGYYRTTSKGGITNSYDWDIDNIARLWTIQDAKDGDVLVASDDSIFIYNGDITKSGSANFYVACTRDNHITFGGDVECGWENKDACLPATKEQRDLLFQKMKEAGYEWNAEHKQLKKIEDESTWSEEDENVITAIIAALSLFAKEKDAEGCFDMEITWLKSLKCKVQPQPKQEFSEYDEYEIDTILAHLKACLNEYTYSRYEKYLKSLRPQNTWKPSEEQMKALDDFIYAKYPNVEKYGAAVKSLYQDLKKLKG